MKIAFVSHVLPPSWSGQSVMIGRIFKGVPAEKYCLISTAKFQNTKDQNAGYLPGRYYSLPPEAKFLRRGARFWITNWIRAYFRGANIASIVKKEKCELIVSASGDLIDIPAAWWASRMTKVDFVPYLFDDYLYQWADQTSRSIAQEMEKRIYGHIKRVIVPNEFLQTEIQNRHQVRAFIVRNPRGESLLQSAKVSLPEYRIQDEIRIVFTGAIYHTNFGAFRNLIAAARLVTPNIKIHLYTAQPIDWLENNGVIGEQVIIHPHAGQAEVAEAQNSAHILFLPLSFNTSIPEVIRTSAPGKMGEYLASGIPVLVHVPPDTFVKWYFNNYDCGLVVDQDDISVLSEAIKELINNPELRNKKSVNALERARIDFNPSLASQAFMQALEMNL